MKSIRIIIIVAVLGYAAFSYFSQASRNDSGQIVSEGELDAFSIRVGDCTNDDDIDFSEDGTAEDIFTVAAVPCDQPHDNEFYYKFDVDHPTFPGDDPLSEEAYNGCHAQFEQFVGKDYDSSVLDIYTIHPSLESWAQNDREVVCALFHIDLEKLTGSVKGLAI